MLWLLNVIFYVSTVFFRNDHFGSDPSVLFVSCLVLDSCCNLILFSNPFVAVLSPTENGRLSYENPNYQLHLNAVRLEDALNSNTEHYNLNSALLSYSMDVISPQLSNMVRKQPLFTTTRVQN